MSFKHYRRQPKSIPAVLAPRFLGKGFGGEVPTVFQSPTRAANTFVVAVFSAALSLATVTSSVTAADPLPSWKDGSAKQSIVDFVTSVTDIDADTFVRPSERIAVFDNDGTLWPEAPMPFQVAFAFDEVKRRVPGEPNLAADPMVQAALRGDVPKLLAGKHHDGLMQILAITHAGMTTAEFDLRVNDWLATAKHPRFQKP